ncbi:MAG: HNH endonuclease [Candidatus Peregrinibacteria bacterium]|nr:HNH endonuclease [Candidatus Peregrinibacteria bacterium]
MIHELSDRELLERCVKFGKEALLWRNKFRALLPEVEKRKLYFKEGYPSIYVFGKILAGLSEEQVSESLHIALRLEDKPALRDLLESGEVSVNKIAKIMSIATVENECELAAKVQIMSTRTLEVFSRDVRNLHVKKPESNLSFAQELHLDEDVRKRLIELEEKGIDINQLLREALDRRDEEIMQAKEQITESLPVQSSRYIPVRVRNILKKEYGQKCAKNGCQKPSQHAHHTRRWAMDGSHDPNFMAPLCREHHQIAHAIDVRVQEMRFR